MKRFQESDATRVVLLLDHEIRSRGRGSIRAVDRATGHSEGWWQHRAASGDITIHQLFQVLDHLGLDPVGFLRRTLGTKRRFGLDRPRGIPPEIVAKAWARMRSGERGSGIGETYLDTLDQQRYQKPAEVVGQALWAVEQVELDLLPRLLGVAGSAWRLLIRLDDAEHAIHTGLEIADWRNDPSAIGNLLQRLSYVAADRGGPAEALRLAERATTIFLRSGDRLALGKALVAQGTWLYYLDRPEGAIESQKAALDYLPPGPSRHRCTAFQCIGASCLTAGNFGAALKNVIAAQEASVGNEAWARGKLLWLRAKIHAELDQLEEAVRHFSEVVDIFRELHPGEAVLATCELVRVQLLQGEPVDAYRTAASMRALLEPLRHNKIISAAIGELLRSGQQGLTLALVQHVVARIEDEHQQNQMWRPLRVSPPE